MEICDGRAFHNPSLSHEMVVDEYDRISSIRLTFLLSLVSSLQMFQQSLLSVFSLSGMSDTQLVFASASFPLGKVISTLWLLLCGSSSHISYSLQMAARLLVLGGIISVFPFTPSLTIGRFLMGTGAGIGFVCAPLFLSSMIPYAFRASHFFVLGVSFAVSTLMANALTVQSFPQHTLIILSSSFSILTGLVYLLFSPPIVDCPSFPSSLPSSSSTSHPLALSNVLMLLNVTCGVPILLGFAPLLFQEFGLPPHVSFYLSLLFPAAQIVLLTFLHFHSHRFTRVSILMGGYGISIFVLFAIATTSQYPFLPLTQKSIALSCWLFILSLVTCVPCNTALCVISEQYSSGSENQMTAGSLSRTLMWLFSAISTSSFLPIMRSFGLFIAFLPYAVSSVILLILVFTWLPPSLPSSPCRQTASVSL